MKKLFVIALALIINAHFVSAQNAKSETKPTQVTEKPKQVPVKMAAQPAPSSNAKPAATAQSTQNAPSREGSVNSKPTKSTENSNAEQTKPVMKKDGTPDKRYKANQNLKKDGTPDKRFKENKPTDSKK
jgi:hypothetical protein